ncbi:DUF4054 domain-containing protein [Candidatus Pacearchaeota archaeon]|nr:DUF4054 domain-containing protein [Candidatus Pacearchaeota archaeon]
MADTTKENVWLIAPEFKCTSPAIIVLVLEDVSGMVGSSYGKKEEIAQRYLAAHLLTLLAEEGETGVRTGIMQERLGDESVTYSKPDKWSSFNSTKYGIMYEMLAKRSVPTANFITP